MEAETEENSGLNPSGCTSDMRFLSVVLTKDLDSLAAQEIVELTPTA